MYGLFQSTDETCVYYMLKQTSMCTFCKVYASGSGINSVSELCPSIAKYRPMPLTANGPGIDSLHFDTGKTLSFCGLDWVEFQLLSRKVDGAKLIQLAQFSGLMLPSNVPSQVGYLRETTSRSSVR